MNMNMEAVFFHPGVASRGKTKKTGRRSTTKNWKSIKNDKGTFPETPSDHTFSSPIGVGSAVDNGLGMAKPYSGQTTRRNSGYVDLDRVDDDPLGHIILPVYDDEETRSMQQKGQHRKPFSTVISGMSSESGPSFEFPGHGDKVGKKNDATQSGQSRAGNLSFAHMFPNAIAVDDAVDNELDMEESYSGQTTQGTSTYVDLDHVNDNPLGNINSPVYGGGTEPRAMLQTTQPLNTVSSIVSDVSLRSGPSFEFPCHRNKINSKVDATQETTAGNLCENVYLDEKADSSIGEGCLRPKDNKREDERRSKRGSAEEELEGACHFPIASTGMPPNRDEFQYDKVGGSLQVDEGSEEVSANNVDDGNGEQPLTESKGCTARKVSPKGIEDGRGEQAQRESKGTGTVKVSRRLGKIWRRLGLTIAGGLAVVLLRTAVRSVARSSRKY